MQLKKGNETTSEATTDQPRVLAEVNLPKIRLARGNPLGPGTRAGEADEGGEWTQTPPLAAEI